jgi:hypothetical protein
MPGVSKSIMNGDMPVDVFVSAESACVVTYARIPIYFSVKAVPPSIAPDMSLGSRLSGSVSAVRMELAGVAATRVKIPRGLLSSGRTARRCYG